MDNRSRQEQSYVATIGVFDGVHRGHRYLIRQVKDEARRRDMQSMVVTFRNHPAHVLKPDSALRLLATADEKAALLRSTGVDQVHWLDFSAQTARLPAPDFMRQVLLPLSVRVLIVGYDHHFGHPRQGEDFASYRHYGQWLGIDVLQAGKMPGDPVSSTAVRQALLEGRVEVATAMLGRPYMLEGEVVGGHHVGTALGFPTANLHLLDGARLLVPRSGAYAVDVQVEGDPLVRRGMLNIGRRPTLDNGDDQSVEVHIFDYCGNLYGRHLRVELLHFLRPEQRFSSLDQLQEQLVKDMAEIKGLQK